MPLSRAALDPALLVHLGKKFAVVGLDGVTADGTNADLVGPITAALGSLGITPATPLVVADADLALVGNSQVGQLVEVATLVGLELVLTNWTAPDQIADTDNQQWLGKLYDSIERTVARSRQQLASQYGFGCGAPVACVFDAGFAETLDLATGRPN